MPGLDLFWSPLEIRFVALEFLKEGLPWHLRATHAGVHDVTFLPPDLAVCLAGKADNPVIVLGNELEELKRLT